MTFLTPAALGLMALSVPVIFMYILKLRRRTVDVSSTFLWRRALDDVQANAPWQRLRISTLLIVQLLALAALVLLQARPAYSRTQPLGGDLILIVDESYGMMMHDVAPSRFGAALSEARGLAANVPSGNVVSVIGMGAQPALAIGESGDLGAVTRAIDGLHDGLAPPNFPEALSLAASLVRGGRPAHAVVLTSRQSGIEALPFTVPFPIEIRRIGGHLHDLGITTFATSVASGKNSALAVVRNFGSTTARSDLKLFVDGQLADVRPLQVAPGRQATLYWNDLPTSARIFRARLTRPDDFAADKQAWAVANAQSPLQVLLVTLGDFFLQTALSIDPAVRLTVVTPSRYRTGTFRRPRSSFDLVVLDGTLPRLRPREAATPVLVISPPAGSDRLNGARITFGRFTATNVVATAPSVSRDAQQILQYLDVSDVHIERTRTMSLPSWMTPIFTSDDVTLLSAGESPDGQRLTVASFDLRESDWPLRISFPILIGNVLHYLVPGLGLDATNVSVGQSLRLAPQPDIRGVEVVRPLGRVEHLRAPFPPFTAGAPGVYRLRESGHGATVYVAATFNPVRPRPAIGPRDLLMRGTEQHSTKSTSVPVEVGWVVALAGLALLTAEWWLSFRR